MTNLPPPDPRSSQRTALGFDEFIGIFVAFTTIGAILFWSLGRKDEGFKLGSILTPSPVPSVQPTLTPTPNATARAIVPVSPLPTVVPTSPEVQATVPNRTPTRTVVPVPVVVPLRPATPAEPVTPASEASPTPPPAQPINFVDVPNDFWARPYIDGLSARGIVNGFPGGYFRPNEPVTRAEFAALLQEAFDKNPGQKVSAFKDVPSNFWAVPAIDRATKSGFLKGYPGDVFRPRQRIPKVQVLVALASGLNLPTPSSPTQTLQTYKDLGQIPNYATQRIAAATEAGLVVNYPESQTLNPNKNATRAEVAAIVYQALAQAGKVEPVESKYVAPTGNTKP